MAARTRRCGLPSVGLQIPNPFVLINSFEAFYSNTFLHQHNTDALAGELQAVEEEMRGRHLLLRLNGVDKYASALG